MQRELFKLANIDDSAKIDEYALAMTDKIKEAEKVFNASLEKLDIHEIDFDEVREAFNKEFRMVNITIEHMEQLKAKQQKQVKQVKAKLNKVEQLKKQIKVCSFKATENNFVSSFFGKLKFSVPKSKIISCSFDKTIKVWDLETKECIKTLSDNTGDINC